MKKIILTLLVLSCLMAIAQTNSADKKENDNTAKNSADWFSNRYAIDLGVEGGPSVIFLYGNPFLRQDYKPGCGFSGAFFFQYNFPKVLSIRTDITFERKGNMAQRVIEATDQNGTDLGPVNLNIHNNIDYLTFPILVRATFGNKIKFYVNAGPYFGALLTDKTITRTNGELYGLPAKATGDNSRFTNKLDVGVSIGTGIEIPIKKGFSVTAEGRNNTGLYNISKVPAVNNGTIKTNSTNFLIGFSYKIAKRS